MLCSYYLFNELKYIDSHVSDKLNAIALSISEFALEVRNFIWDLDDVPIHELLAYFLIECSFIVFLAAYIGSNNKINILNIESQAINMQIDTNKKVHLASENLICL